jgi:hypothetical protein
MLIAHADRLRWVSGGSRCHWHPKSSVPLFFFFAWSLFAASTWGFSQIRPTGFAPHDAPPPKHGSAERATGEFGASHCQQEQVNGRRRYREPRSSPRALC